MGAFITFIDRIGTFLNIQIIENSYVFLNFWSIVHLCVGILLMLILSIFFKGFKRFYWLIIILAIWEGFEYIMYGVIKSPRWIPETLVDVTWDFITAILGAIITAVLLVFIKKK